MVRGLGAAHAQGMVHRNLKPAKILVGEDDSGRKIGRINDFTLVKLAEDLLPRLRVAEWRDRAEAAQRQIEHLDLRDLRSVVAAANDPAVARDETARPLVDEMKAALVTKQEQELLLWFGDVDAALAVGRVVRALRLSSQPPKAGVPFPADIAQRLADSTNASLAPMDSPDRWIAMLEAAAFSPIRHQISPARKPDTVNDELTATVKRLAPALPQVAALFEIEVDPDAPMPKPLRQNPRTRGAGKGGPAKQRADRPKKPAKKAQAKAPRSGDSTPSESDETAATERPVESEPSVTEAPEAPAEPTTSGPADSGGEEPSAPAADEGTTDMAESSPAPQAAETVPEAVEAPADSPEADIDTAETDEASDDAAEPAADSPEAGTDEPD
jgi:hypothetical protein